MRDRLLRDGFLLFCLAFIGLRLFAVEPWDDSVDAYAYWATGDGTFYDASATGRIGAYLYSPAFAQLIGPATHLPWPVFAAGWTALNCAALWWLLGRWSLPALLFVPIPFEIVSGNVHLLIAVALVVGLRASGAASAGGAAARGALTWLLPLITKVTPGLGLLWFVVRREWRPLAVALGSTFFVAAASFALAPDAWREWLAILARDTGGPGDTPGWYLPVPLLLRLPVAAAIVVLAGFTGRAWLVPVGVTLGLPVVWLNSLAVLTAAVPLARGGTAR